MLKTQSPEMLVPARGDDFLPPIGRWASAGSLFIVGAIGTAIFLASAIKYNVTVKASATVRPVGELRLVQTPIEGTIKSIEVKENQQVKQGDAIARIDDSQVQLKKSQLQGNIEQDKLQLAQMDAQIKAVRTQILAESQLRDRTVAAAQAELARNQRDWQDRQATALSDLKEAEATLSLARDGLTRYQKLVDSGAIAQLQLREKEAAVQSAEAKLERAISALNPSSANVAIAQERIAQEVAKGDSTLATLRKEIENLNQRQVEAQNQLHRHLKDLQQVENELQKSTIRATSDGIVLKLNLRNSNQFVRSGEAIAQIAPNAAPLVVKARVATQDIDKVLVNQKVQLRVNACPYPDYGTLNGIVTAISPDVVALSNSPDTIAASTPIPQNANVNSAASHFEVTIQPEKLVLSRGERQCRIQAGLEIEANIISKEETALQFLLRKTRLLADL